MSVLVGLKKLFTWKSRRHYLLIWLFVVSSTGKKERLCQAIRQRTKRFLAQKKHTAPFVSRLFQCRTGNIDVARERARVSMVKGRQSTRISGVTPVATTLGENETKIDEHLAIVSSQSNRGSPIVLRENRSRQRNVRDTLFMPVLPTNLQSLSLLHSTAHAVQNKKNKKKIQQAKEKVSHSTPLHHFFTPDRSSRCLC